MDCFDSNGRDSSSCRPDLHLLTFFFSSSSLQFYSFPDESVGMFTFTNATNANGILPVYMKVKGSNVSGKVYGSPKYHTHYLAFSFSFSFCRNLCAESKRSSWPVQLGGRGSDSAVVRRHRVDHVVVRVCECELRTVRSSRMHLDFEGMVRVVCVFLKKKSSDNDRWIFDEPPLLFSFLFCVLFASL